MESDVSVAACVRYWHTRTNVRDHWKVAHRGPVSLGNGTTRPGITRKCHIAVRSGITVIWHIAIRDISTSGLGRCCVVTDALEGGTAVITSSEITKSHHMIVGQWKLY